MYTSIRIFFVPSLIAGLLLISGCTRQEVPSENTELDLSRARELFGVPLERPAAMDQQAVIVKIDNRTITQADLNLEAAKLLRNVRQPIPPERVAQARQQIVNKAIENLVVSALLLNAANQEDLPVSDDELSAAMDKLKANLDPNMTWEEFLSTNSLTVAKVETKLKQDIKLSKLIEQKTAGLTAPDGVTVQKFYEENLERFKVPEAVEARQVLIALDENDDEAAKARKKGEAEKVRRQLAAGADFEQVAADAGMKNGGRLGVVYKGRSLPELDEVAFSLEPGAISDIITTERGYHVVQVTKKIPGRTVPLEEARPDIILLLSRQDQQQAIREYVKKLRDAATIEFLKK